MEYININNVTHITDAGSLTDAGQLHRVYFIGGKDILIRDGDALLQTIARRSGRQQWYTIIHYASRDPVML